LAHVAEVDESVLDDHVPGLAARRLVVKDRLEADARVVDEASQVEAEETFRVVGKKQGTVHDLDVVLGSMRLGLVEEPLAQEFRRAELGKVPDA
jgi:hypothetical protein